jgi:hypothetical protein
MAGCSGSTTTPSSTSISTSVSTSIPSTTSIPPAPGQTTVTTTTVTVPPGVTSTTSTTTTSRSITTTSASTTTSVTSSTSTSTTTSVTAQVFSQRYQQTGVIDLSVFFNLPTGSTFQIRPFAVTTYNMTGGFRLNSGLIGTITGTLAVTSPSVPPDGNLQSLRLNVQTPSNCSDNETMNGTISKSSLNWTPNSDSTCSDSVLNSTGAFQNVPASSAPPIKYTTTTTSIPAPTASFTVTPDANSGAPPGQCAVGQVGNSNQLTCTFDASASTPAGASTTYAWEIPSGGQPFTGVILRGVMIPCGAFGTGTGSVAEPIKLTVSVPGAGSASTIKTVTFIKIGSC